LERDKNKKATGLMSVAFAEISINQSDKFTPGSGQVATRHARRTQRHRATGANRKGEEIIGPLCRLFVRCVNGILTSQP
jgi:hypothetical protein